MQRQVTFVEAVQRGLQNYAVFNGRASRSEYWWFVVFSILVSAACVAISDALSSVVGIALFLPQLGLSVRRLHDTGRSGWWYCINLLPVIGSIIFIVFAAQESKPANEYGDVPNLI